MLSSFYSHIMTKTCSSSSHPSSEEETEDLSYTNAACLCLICGSRVHQTRVSPSSSQFIASCSKLIFFCLYRIALSLQENREIAVFFIMVSNKTKQKISENYYITYTQFAHTSCHYCNKKGFFFFFLPNVIILSPTFTTLPKKKFRHIIIHFITNFLFIFI